MEGAVNAPPAVPFHATDTHRLVSTRFPTVGLLDAVADWNDLNLLFELQSWTNDRISSELGYLNLMPREEWVIGKPFASVVMATFCHPRQGGSRFNGEDRGAWYSALSLETAHAETVYHRTAELAEIGVFETRMQMCLYLTDFHAIFHDIRAPLPENEPYHDQASYVSSQALGRRLLAEGSRGIVYRSVRHWGGECIAAFWPKVVENVRIAGHFEYRWQGTRDPQIHRLRYDAGVLPPESNPMSTE